MSSLRFEDLEALVKNPLPPHWLENNRNQLEGAVSSLDELALDEDEYNETVNNFLTDCMRQKLFDLLSEVLLHLTPRFADEYAMWLIDGFREYQECDTDIAAIDHALSMHIPRLTTPSKTVVYFLDSGAADGDSRNVLEQLCARIDWQTYHDERETNADMHWEMPARCTTIAENPQRVWVLDVLASHSPEILIDSVKILLSMHLQGGYVPSKDRLDVMNTQLLARIGGEHFGPLYHMFEDAKRRKPGVDMPASLLRWKLQEETQNSSLNRPRKM